MPINNSGSKLQLIFGIRGIVVDAIPYSLKDGQVEHHRVSEQTLLYFLRTTSLYFTKSSSPLPQCVLPGYTELLQLLFSHPMAENVNVSFFENGPEGTNKLILREIFNKAFESFAGREMLSNTVIRSANHCRYASDIDLMLLESRFGVKTTEWDVKKDIFKIVDQSEKHNALLIDADMRSICYFQVNNFLGVPAGSIKAFDLRYTSTLSCQTADDPLFQELNRIFYLTGLLLEVIDDFCKTRDGKNVATEDTVTQKLFNMQFEIVPTVNGIVKLFRPRLHELYSKQEYYEKGLAALQQFNPSLSFITPQHIQEVTNRPISEEEKLFLDKRKPLEPSTPREFQFSSMRLKA